MNKINQEQLTHLVKGACFLSSAGGGTYTSGMNLASCFGEKEYYAGTKEVDLVQPEELEKDKYAVMVAYIGAPECMEKIFYPQGIVAAVEELAAKKGIRIDYIIPPEIGAISMLAACTAAAKLGIAVVDGDGAGRAVPELSMTVFSLYQEDVNPVVLGSQEGNNALYMELNGGLNEAGNVEKLIRPVLGMECFGEKAGLAMWLMSGEKAKHIIQSKHTISQGIGLGKLLNRKNLDIEAIFKHVSQMGYEAELVAEGSGMVVCTDTGGGFDNGTLRFVTTVDNATCGTQTGDEITVLFKNESLIAWSSSRNEPLVVAPDLISYLVSFPEQEEKGKEKMPQWVYSNGDLQRVSPERLRDGEIKLIKMKAPDWVWKQERQMISKRNLQLRSGKTSSSVQQSYQHVLRSLGYYGKVGE